VKGLSDSEDDEEDVHNSPVGTPKRGRGRPRKSAGTPVRRGTRTVTPGAQPAGRRRRTLGDLVDGDDENDWDFEIGAGVEISRGKGRSQSRSAKPTGRVKSTPAPKQKVAAETTSSSTTRKSSRTRRKTLTPEEFLIQEDSPAGRATADESAQIPSSYERVRALTPIDLNIVSSKDGHASVRSTKESAGSTGTSHSSKVVEASLIQRPAGHAPRLRTDHSDDQPEPAEALEQDEVAYQEFDTILESEGFSMISVDSVSSLREHLSSPAGPFELEQLVRPPRPLSREQVSTPAGPFDLEKFLRPSQVAKTTPLRRLRGTANREDSFSSIAPEILEAATPGRRLLNATVSALRSANTSAMADSFSSVPHEILEAATPRVAPARSRPAYGHATKERTPAPSSPVRPPRDETDLEKAQKAVADEPVSHNTVAAVGGTTSLQIPTVGRRISSSNTSGLLSPERTPEPPETTPAPVDDARQGQTIAVPTDHQTARTVDEGSSVMSSHFRSSPPPIVPQRYTYTAHLRRNQALYSNISETPSIVFSSPALPPLLQPTNPERRRSSDDTSNNDQLQKSFSPTVRAGRVLQDIATTSPSRTRSQSLRSPFKSPTAQKSTIPANIHNDTARKSAVEPYSRLQHIKASAGGLLAGFSDDTRRELRQSLIIGEQLAQDATQTQVRVNRATVAGPQDPFSNSVRQLPNPSANDSEPYTLGLPKQPKFGFGSARSEGAMSWQAEQTVTVTAARPSSKSSMKDVSMRDASYHEPATLLQRRREAESARERADVSSRIESADPSQIIEISSDVDDDDSDSEDIWVAEARNSSSMIREQLTPAPQRQEYVEKPRRSKLPSPWRKNSKRLVYSDELARVSPPPQMEQVRSVEPAPVEPTPEPVEANNPTEEEDDDLEPDFSMVAPIPQKRNFAPRPRSSGNLNLSMLLGSPVKSLAPPDTPAKAPESPIEESILEDPEPTPLYPTLSAAEEILPSPQSIREADTSAVSEESSIASITESVDETESSLAEDSVEEETEDSAQYTEESIAPPPPQLLKPPTPQKSCLRTPTSLSPTKTVAFKSPTPSPAPLSSTEWSKQHWKLLDEIWRHHRKMPAEQVGNTLVSTSSDAKKKKKPSDWLGETLDAKGYSLVVKKWHLDIVEDFRREVPGWEEGYTVKRLFSLVVGEQMRREGKAKPRTDIDEGLGKEHRTGDRRRKV
jgi:serine/arginine repetitive matrix protein 2